MDSYNYVYSAKSYDEVEAIRKRYVREEPDALEQLKSLDSKVRTAGTLEGLTLGIIGALVFGIGLCIGLDAIGGSDVLSVLFCIAGALMMIPAYPISKRISNKTKAELTPEILKLSDEILKG